MLKIIKYIVICLPLVIAPPLKGSNMEPVPEFHDIHLEEMVAKKARKAFSMSAVFLKILLTGTETYAFALEVGAEGSSAAVLTSSGTSQLVAGLGSGLTPGAMHGVGIGLAKVAVGLGMTNLWTGVAMLGVAVVTSAVVEEWADRLEKTAVRMNALSSLSAQIGEGSTLKQYHVQLLGTDQSFTHLAQKADKRRVKYHCKRAKAMQHGQKNKIKDALFCIWNNAAPKDYLCEFLGNLKRDEQHNTLNQIAPIFKNGIINVYRRILKYRFLDKYYTAVNNDYEGLAIIRSATNIADRLNASEFWMPDSPPNLIDTLNEMREESQLMKDINACHTRGCDERSDREIKKEHVFVDRSSSEKYENYCDYYFRKSPIHLGTLRNMGSSGIQMVRKQFGSAQEYNRYVQKEMKKRELLIDNANDNFKKLVEIVEKLDGEKQTTEALQSIEELGEASQRYQALMTEIAKVKEEERQDLIRKWMSDPQNQKAYNSIKNATNYLREEGAIADQDAEDEAAGGDDV